MGYVLTRRPDWRERLHAFLDASRKRRFCWGAWDCVQFAGGAIEAVTGVNPSADYRGTYRTPREAITVLRSRGYRALPDAVTDALGEPVRGLQAAEGDLVETAGPGLAVCTGVYAAALGPSGLEMLPPAAWRRAWRIGACPR